ncbi:hypothetical protein DES53_1151 [Roseimicrobium gellanilyticum]|uniref:Uncharacterized protein n=2 Tax=Roseimicrobium gellanilyticum TaxID=748857 RepID=A0A366H793_9BACT|nr:hypothetical protein DES53_1151 [Roseimicrobium gellanilyticum]
MRARTTPRCAFVTPEIDIEKVENAIKKMSLVRFSIFLAKLGLDEDEFCDSWAPAERLRVFKKLRASGEITWEQVVSKLTNPKSFIKQTPQGPGTSPTCVNVLADLQRSHSLLDAAMFALKNLQKGCNLNMPPGHV